MHHRRGGLSGGLRSAGRLLRLLVRRSWSSYFTCCISAVAVPERLVDATYLGLVFNASPTGLAPGSGIAPRTRRRTRPLHHSLEETSVVTVSFMVVPTLTVLFFGPAGRSTASIGRDALRGARFMLCVALVIRTTNKGAGYRQRRCIQASLRRHRWGGSNRAEELIGQGTAELAA
jgi:hypothetical protein